MPFEPGVYADLAAVSFVRAVIALDLGPQVSVLASCATLAANGASQEQLELALDSARGVSGRIAHDEDLAELVPDPYRRMVAERRCVLGTLFLRRALGQGIDPRLGAVRA